MQINKIIKKLILAISFMVISACNYRKTNNNESFTMNYSTKIGININKKNLSDKELVPLQMQKLQHNNIVYFDLEKYDIRSEFYQKLETYANFLSKNPSWIVKIEGHTDEYGTPEYNIVLGERRANAVKIYLQSKGVSSEQISLISYGKEKSAALGHDETFYAKNRRAVLIFSRVLHEN
ncbi:MAG: peptidoglycan-associated lipoprotein Pal [Sodalis sp. (in: enterobacteria)]